MIYIYIYICYYRVTWVQIQGTKYEEGSVVLLDSTGILPIFGMITNILLIKSDEPYFVCEGLNTEEFSSHFHSFIVQRNKPIPIAFCKPGDLSDNHTIGLYSFKAFTLDCYNSLHCTTISYNVTTHVLFKIHM